jgi:hypothetical protein
MAGGLSEAMAGGLDAADVGPFLARLVRLDPGAVVRLRPAGPGAVALWARVPWGVLVTRTVPGPDLSDTTVGATALLTSLTQSDGEPAPPSRDRDWRWALPPGPGRVVETLPDGELRRLGTAAADALREGRGRAGERMLRDALLDHVPITVTADDQKIHISQRLVQALLRMAFMNTDGLAHVTVRVSGTWVGLGALYGSAWLQNAPSLTIQLAK